MQCCDGSLLSPVVRSVLLSVDKIAGIVARAISAAVAQQRRIREVRADLFRAGPEVVQAVFLIGQYSSVGDKDAVSTDTLARVWQVQGVVESKRCLRVLETI